MPLSHRLPVFKIIAASLSIAWFNWREYSKAIAAPTLLLVVVWAATAVFSDAERAYVGWIAMPFYALAFSLFAVTCHRFILVQSHARSAGSIAIGRRELRFMVWAVGVYALVSVLTMLPLTVLINIDNLAEARDREEAFEWMQLLASIPAYYVLGRISLVFPALALERVMNLRASWQATQGNGWRMFVIVGLFPWAVSSAIWILWRDEATVMEQALLTIFSYIGLSIGIFALSFAYREFDKCGLLPTGSP